MGTIDIIGAIHIKLRQTLTETISDANTDAQFEWIFRARNLHILKVLLKY